MTVMIFAAGKSSYLPAKGFADLGRDVFPSLLARGLDLHDLTCFIPLGTRFARVQLRVFLTPPNTLWTPVLGRADFFQQVDFALVQADWRFHPRFRDPSVVREGW